ncbi:MAG: monofunctional biosynthetic peptidoglycan transglycosylase [Verrucomicrobiae bacterium]|nr:monofunctional biosynthetic peptidoglycan transglycosylase [Verrucomicrobiae bacterium]
MRPKTNRRLKRAVLTAYVVLLVPVLQVGCVGLVNPPTTGPMALRWLKGKFTAGEQQRNRYCWLDLRGVPNDFLKCILVSEDHRFFEHWGFDWEEIRIARAEARARGQPARGASTITQQCARSLFLWQGRSWIRKGLEAYYTVWMELLLSKRRILELYVNVIELGDGVFGVEAGARHHYGIPAEQLSREQAAMLAAILPNPRDWNPKQPNERVLKRQAIILKRAETAWLPLEQTE